MSASQQGQGRKRPARYKRGELREQMILKAAREIFLAVGWDHFSIERIAEYMECSRPLIYDHFASKEEILLALSIENTKLRIRLSEKALEFKGRPRERLVAYGEADRQLTERHLPIQLLVTSTRNRAKTTQARQDESNALQSKSISLGAGIVKEAIEAGDLVLPGAMTPEDLYFAIWAFTWGALNIRRSDFPLEQSGIINARRTMHKSLGIMLDGFGWRPLSSEWDYRKTLARVHEEVFTPEVIEKLVSD